MEKCRFGCAHIRPSSLVMQELSRCYILPRNSSKSNEFFIFGWMFAHESRVPGQKLAYTYAKICICTTSEYSHLDLLAPCTGMQQLQLSTNKRCSKAGAPMVGYYAQITEGESSMWRPCSFLKSGLWNCRIMGRRLKLPVYHGPISRPQHHAVYVFATS